MPGETKERVSAPAARAAAPRNVQLTEHYRRVRRATEELCRPLELEDYVVQSMPDASPVKWHLGHTTWFFETFVLRAARPDEPPFHPQFDYLFNSYYNAVGDRQPRPRRGLLTRPTVEDVLCYRRSVDERMLGVLQDRLADELAAVVEIGLHHEQQHQELILTDLKHLFWQNPLRPAYLASSEHAETSTQPGGSSTVPSVHWITHDGGRRWIGFDRDGFVYDNERPRHEVLLQPFRLADRPVTNAEYLEFIDDGGYRRPELWLSDGWDVVQRRGWQTPLYWERGDGRCRSFTLGGMRPLESSEPVCHVSFYEADAYARWAGARLPSEAEWEAAACRIPVAGNFVEAGRLHPAPLDGSQVDRAAGRGAPPPVRQLYGDVWEWTASPYGPYPGYRPPQGALGEYNGKFMCNQIVLRGGSCVTAVSHIRPTYRNFFKPEARWQFSGIRLARDGNGGSTVASP